MTLRKIDRGAVRGAAGRVTGLSALDRGRAACREAVERVKEHQTRNAGKKPKTLTQAETPPSRLIRASLLFRRALQEQVVETRNDPRWWPSI